MKNLKKILSVFVVLSCLCVFSAERKFVLPTRPGTDNQCRLWKDGRYKVVSDGISLPGNKLCYNASVLPLNGAKHAYLSFKYRGKDTRCGLFYYSKNSGLLGRDLVYLPNTETLRKFDGKFAIPPTVKNRQVVGVRLVFLTGKQGVVDIHLSCCKVNCRTAAIIIV